MGIKREKPTTDSYQDMMANGCPCGATADRVVETKTFLGDEVAECQRCGLRVNKYKVEDY